MVSRILVALDGSAFAESALSCLEPLLAATKAEVLLVQAVLPPVGADGKALLSALIEADDYLSRTARRLGDAGIRARTSIAPGPAAEAIVEAATRDRADCIVMSTRGRTGFARFALGSVTDMVVRASRVPVLVIPAGVREPVPFRNILVTFDGSPLSLQVAPAVKALAKPLGASVHVVHVMELLWHAATWSAPDLPVKDAADDYLAAGLPTTIEIRKGDAAVEILEAASECGADMIAMATRGRSGPSRRALGSVTEKVLRAATRPLLVVRAPRDDMED